MALAIVLGAQANAFSPIYAQSASPPPKSPQESSPPAQTAIDPAPTLRLRSFADVQFRAVDDDTNTSTFALGQLDLFMTSELGDSFSVLAETVLEANEENRFGFEIERLQLQYFPNDYLKLIIGRYHTSIGYYNTAYHHGTWFQTATGRPILFAFEDEGGILPVHEVGVSVSGLIPSGRANLHYLAEVGNGRRWGGRDTEPVQNVVDETSGKAVNVGFFARPDACTGLQLGMSFYRDRLEFTDLPTVTYEIISAHAVYERPGVEVLNELVLVRQRQDRTTYTSPGFYSQISKSIGNVRPYVRYQYLDVKEGTPIPGATGRVSGPSLGLRFDAGTFVALKAQFDRFSRRGKGAAHELTVQMAFTF